MSNQSFLAGPGALDGVRAGDTLTLDGPEGHHAVAVKRVRAGEAIDLVDGRGRRAVCTVTATAKAGLDARVDELHTDPAPAVSTVLVQALAKGDRDLLAVESAVELGIDRVVPWQAERCVVRWQGDRAAKGQAKWESTVRAALKQSRRSRLPAVEPVLTTAQLAARCATGGGSAAAERLAIVLHEQAQRPLGAVVAEWMAARARYEAPEAPAPAEALPGEILLIVGPEGGISDTEVERLAAAGAVPARLGSHVLRASTAGPAALVLVRHLAGLLD
ncbi:ribosomal RNA small subunit methyltransferase E [Zafaria cholistanensis]|uniref:Ribosomal RNA small subunit methyltransferase E n=1 Tax=Zafaria cholistanensis TaxID=1682741 RepID=A0A5A7NNP3_9MICC|nr:16S rRNA (uracil(1498)-N(3))-methyltransferase [Zafaria cholistanensis]GER22146.1 ribosomal RNA small subunit methyltransferase E [Zafaria cholistanensis]